MDRERLEELDKAYRNLVLKGKIGTHHTVALVNKWLCETRELIAGIKQSHKENERLHELLEEYQTTWREGLSLFWCDDLKKENSEFQDRIKKLEGYLDKTADGKLVVECEGFYCPKCAGKVRRHEVMSGLPWRWCIECLLGFSESDCYSTPEATKLASK